MPSDIRVGGAYITYSANAGQYLAGTNQVIAANRRVTASVFPMVDVVDRFRSSVTASLIATAAYVVGVGAVSAALRGSIGGALEFDDLLGNIAKTTDLADESLAKLGERLARIGTEGINAQKGIALTTRELLNIAVVVGQAGISDPAGIAALTQTAAALQISSNLIGVDAVRAITRYLEVTGQGIERSNALASAFTHLGNNIVATEAEIASFARKIAQETSVLGQLSDELILGITAVFVASGAKEESAGSTLQRTIRALNESLSGGGETFLALGRLAGRSAEEVEALRGRLISSTVAAKDYDSALRILLVALGRAPKATGAGTSQQGILEAVFGDSNVRTTAAIGALVKNLSNLDEKVELARDGLEKQNFHFLENERSAKKFKDRLQEVRNELAVQSRSIGQSVVPSLVNLAEEYLFIEGAAAGLVSSLALGFGTRSASRGLSAQRRESDKARKSLKALNQERKAEGRIFQNQKNLIRGRLLLQKEESGLKRSLTTQTVALSQARQAEGRSAGAGLLVSLPAVRKNAENLARKAKDAAARVGKTQSRLAKIEQQRAIILSSSSGLNIKNLNSEARVTRALEREKQRLTRAQEKSVAATRAYNQQVLIAKRNNSLVSVVTRGVGRAFLTLLSPINLLLIGLPIITGLMAKFFGTMTTAQKEARDLTEALGRLEVQQVLSSGVDSTSLDIAYVRDVLNRRQEKQKELDREAKIGVKLRFRGRGGKTQEIFYNRGIANDYRNETAEIQKRLGALDISAEVNEKMNYSAKLALNTFKALNLELPLAGAGVANFLRQFDLQKLAELDDARASALVAATPGLDEQGRVYEGLARDAQKTLDAEIQRLTVARDSALLVAQVRGKQANQALQAFSGFDIGDPVRKDAESQYKAALARSEAADRDVIVRGKELRIGEEELRLSTSNLAILRQTAEAQAQLTINRLEGFRPEARLPDLSESNDAAFSLTESITDANRALVNQVDFLNETSALSERQLAAASAEAEVRQKYVQAQLFSDREVLSQRRLILGLEVQRDELTRAILKSEGDVKIAYLEQRNAIVSALFAAQEQLDVSVASRDALASVADEVERAARASRQFSEELYDAQNVKFPQLKALEGEGIDFENIKSGGFTDMQDDVMKLSDLIDNNLSSSIGHLESALVDMFSTGKFAVKDLANAIATDLIASLIRTTITANLASIALSFIPGYGTPSPSGRPGAPGVGASTAPRFHSGGVVSGLGAKEMMAVLEKDEEVITRHDPRHRWNIRGQDAESLRSWVDRLPRYHSGGVVGGGSGGGGGADVEVRVINPPGAPVAEVESSNMRIDGDKLVVSVFLQDVKKNGPITRTIKQLARG